LALGLFVQNAISQTSNLFGGKRIGRISVLLGHEKKAGHFHIGAVQGAKGSMSMQGQSLESFVWNAPSSKIDLKAPSPGHSRHFDFCLTPLIIVIPAFWPLLARGCETENRALR
jgi:hypothetical protein